jgi:hypothetical protein
MITQATIERQLNEGQLRKLQQVGSDFEHPDGHSHIISLPHSYVKHFKLRKGEWFDWSIADENGPTFTLRRIEVPNK